MTLPTITYKEFYNKDRGLPEPVRGDSAIDLQCPTCSSREMYYSGSVDDPEEVFGAAGSVMCGHCGHITDCYEAYKQLVYHSTDVVREVVHDNC